MQDKTDSPAFEEKVQTLPGPIKNICIDESLMV